MRRWLLVPVLAGFVVTPVLAADAPDTTAGMRNGRYWTKAPAAAKTGYIIGLLDGLRLESDGKAGWSEVMRKCRCTMGELSDGLDAIYKQPLYLKLPVGVAASLYSESASGASDDQIAELARQYLKEYSEDTTKR